MRLYRLCKQRHAKTFKDAFSGYGAYQYGGRWNRKGQYAAYTSSSIALATLEILVHADLEDLPNDLVCASIKVPDGIAIHRIEPHQLPNNWRNNDPTPNALADIGSNYLTQNKHLLMQVPSAVIPSEYNYIVNPLHTDFSRLTDFQLSRFEVDPRLGIMPL